MTRAFRPVRDTPIAGRASGRTIRACAPAESQATYLRAEVERWGKLVREAGIKAD